MSEKDGMIDVPQAILELTEESLKVAKEARDLSKQAMGEHDGVKRTQTEQKEKLEQALAAVTDLNRKLDAADRKIVFNEMDPMRLKYDRSQRSFEQMMRSKPEAGSKLASIVEDVQLWNTRAALVKTMAEAQLGRRLTWDECLEMEDGRLDSLRCSKSEYRPFANFDRGVRQLAEGLGFKHVRALDTSTTTEGAEWNVALMGTQLMRKMAVALRAAGLIQSIPLPSASWYWPYETAFPTAQRVTESTALASNPWATSGVTEAYAAATPSDRVQFNARKVRLAQFKSWEFDVDSVIAAEDWLLERIAYGNSRAKETGMFNGDRSSTHLDADITGIGSSGTAPETVVDGLRNFYLAQSSIPSVDVAATPTTQDYLNMIALLGKEYMVDLAQQYFFATPLGTVHMMANKDMRTLNELGPQAVIVSGQVGEKLGRPVVMSGLMRDDIASTGVNVSGGDNTKTSILLAHLGMWKWGTRPAHPLEVERLPLTDQSVIVVHDRYDLQFVGAATDKCVAAIHGIPSNITAV